MAAAVCGCRTGVFYVRQCGKPSEFQCGQCGLPLCNEHANNLESEPWRIFCPECFARLKGEQDVYSDLDYDRPAFHAGGWRGTHRGDTTTGLDQDQAMREAAFDEEDYAAFDALSDVDEKTGLDHGYDS